MKKIKMYLRKSRNDNQFESIDDVLEKHEKQLQDFMIRITGEKIPPSQIYKEVVSGETIDNRPMMLQLLNEIESDLIEAVVVVEPQRLSRGAFSDIGRIIDTFKFTNTKIITPLKTYDLNDKFDKKFFEQELLRGNDYLEYVKEILTRGRIQSVKDGLYVGSIAPFGYDKVKLKKGNTLKPNSDADTVRFIFNEYYNGLGLIKLAKEINRLGLKSATNSQWTVNMIRNILTSEIYIGYLTYGKNPNKKIMVNGEIVKVRKRVDEFIRVKGLHEPIIEEELFYKTQELLHSKIAKKVKSDVSLQNPLASLVKCYYCGGNMLRKTSGVNTTASLFCNNFSCKCVSNKLADVENRVIELLIKELKDYKYYIDEFDETKKDNANMYHKQLKKIDKELEQLKHDLQNALLKYNRGSLEEDEYIFLRDYVKKEKQRLESVKIALNDKLEIKESDSKRTAIPILDKCIKKYHTLTSAKDKNDLLSSIIDKIVYKKDKKDGKLKDGEKPSFELDIFLKI